MKRIVFVFLLACILVLSGCGKITKSAGLSDTSDDAPTPADAAILTEEQEVDAFLNALQGLNISYIQGLGVQGTETVVTNATAGFSLQAVGVQSIAYDDGFAYWETVVGSKTIGQINETWEAKRRYYDKRTGQPFDKLPSVFTAADWQNVDYIEQLQTISGVYAATPDKNLYKVFYHHKVVPTATGYTYTSFPGTTSTIAYYSYPNTNTTQADTLNVTDQTLTYDKTTGRLIGTLSCQGARTNQNKATITISAQGATVLSEQIATFYNSKAISTIEIAGAGGVIQTKYVVGPSSTYYYSSISSLLSNRRLEDNATIEIQDSRSYSNSFTFDGLGTNNRLDQTSPLKNFALRGKAGQRPTISGTMTLRNIAGVAIDNLTFTRTATVQACTAVVITDTTGTINQVP